MVEIIDLSTFKLTSNYLLVKLDPSYDFVEITGPAGKKIELQLVSFGDQAANHYSISGIVLVKPEKTFFFDKQDDKYLLTGGEEFQSLMKESLDVDCEYDINTGDKIYFNYNVQLSAANEQRIVETKEHGICMLISLNFVFGYERDGEIIPVNGYVFFKRDETQTELTLKYGLIGIQKANPYGSSFGTVIVADKPAKRYLDGQNEPHISLEKDTRILIDKRFGYRMAYDMHTETLKSVEVIQRKQIMLVLEEQETA